MKRLFHLISAIIIFGSVPLDAQEEVRFMDGSLAAILSIAQERQQNVFIDTYADWCIPCKRMEEKFKDKDVAAFFNEHFINYRVNMQNPERANDLRRKYDVVFLPTMYILDPNGIVKYQADRELSVSELLNAAQQSLDPGSYHQYDATAIRRNDGTITGGISHETVGQEVPDPDPKSTPTNSDVVTAQPVAAPTSTSMPQDALSSSAATRRAQILDKYETVDESSEKVLAVLGADDLPPEVLRQEAYLRLEFMDGSSKRAATKYLETQYNWETDENQKFIMDFIHTTSSEMYTFLIAHKAAFITQFGPEKVQRTLDVLTYRTLYNAVPRPTLAEATALYANMDEPSARRKAHHYFVNRLILDDEIDQVVTLCDEYLKSSSTDHQIKYMVAQYLLNRKGTTEDDLKKAKKYIESAIDDQPKSHLYLDLLGNVYTQLGEDERAKKAFDKAKNLEPESGNNNDKR